MRECHFSPSSSLSGVWAHSLRPRSGWDQITLFSQDISSMNDEPPPNADLNRWYYPELAAAFVRGRLPDAPESATVKELLELGKQAGLRLHKFKRNIELPRVRRVIGILHGLAPTELLDIGSGRGTFLWPMLDSFPELPVTAIDHSAQRASDLQAVTWGGISRLTAMEGDVCKLPFDDQSFDVVTILEVLEHLPDALAGASEVLRVARRFVVASVPSKPDDNPEHLRLYTHQTLTELFNDAAGALNIIVSVQCQHVHNHIIAVVHRA